MVKRYLILTLLISLGFATIALAITERKEEPVKAGESLIIAHRGANDRFNEHTLTAYKIASQDGVDYLEIDLRMTKDGELVAMHDDTIDRTTNGKGKVSDYTLAELKKFKTVSTFENKVVSEEIPSLREIFDEFSGTENFYIETRLVNNQLAMEEKVIALLDEYHLLDDKRVILQSFSTKSLEKLSRLAPDLPLTFLFKKGKFDLNKAIATDYPIIGIESSDVTNRIVKKLHNNGKKVHVYFTNKKTQKREQTQLKDLPIDGYFTDYILYTKKL
ncbi:glycerophosphodiester phosphodiesterase family protein [Fredinandcohnia sp. QZ13]|uniref:glycerophosphodiester phosphodiesterase n=1 Tax=Fredinandcohnia sp. QZ13 TaxID=3073144 RepID=UPI00285351DB|nr:glycerophosphodiester phosphodiesterase family protein [Fredinandcohnia sp. QZ13]MDR4889754.1 glycerophosphodiester phosphodiesterase family protein [Fredinandcohnia sp. QZ13]